MGPCERSLHRRSHSSIRPKCSSRLAACPCRKQARSARRDFAQQKSSLKSGRSMALRRLVTVVGLLAAGTGGFIGSRPAPTRSSPRRFAAPKRKPGQRGSARAKERLRKALEKEGAPPPRKDPLPTTTTTTSPSRVELRRRAGLPPIEPMLRRAPADLTEKSVAARGSAKSANSCLRHMNDLASMDERTRPFPRRRPRRTPSTFP